MEAQSVHVHGKIRRISRSCFSYIVFIRWINKDSPQHTTIWKQQQYTLIANIQQHTTMYNNIQQWFNNIQQSTTTIYNNLQYVVNSIHTPDFENSHVTTRQRNAQAISPWQRSSNASPVTSKTGIGFFTHIAVSMLCLVPYATSLHGSVRRLRCTTYLARYGGFHSLGDPKKKYAGLFMESPKIISHRIHVWYIYANIWGILMVNVTIHGSYGYGWELGVPLF